MHHIPKNTSHNIIHTCKLSLHEDSNYSKYSSDIMFGGKQGHMAAHCRIRPAHLVDLRAYPIGGRISCLHLCV